jgi:hypothetical protein
MRPVRSPHPRRQRVAGPQRALATGLDDLRPQPHDEPHPEAGRAAGVVRLRDDRLQPFERQVVLPRPRAADDVHVHVAVRVERRVGRLRARVDPRQLGRRIAGVVDRLEEQPLVTRVLRGGQPDVLALPEPGPFRLGAGRGGDGEEEHEGGDGDTHSG